MDTALKVLPIAYEFTERPEAGETMQVAPGITWLRMPLPIALGHINLWLLEDGDGWAAVDTGVCIDESKRVWEKTFASPMSGRPLNRVIVTHMHPDHVGGNENFGKMGTLIFGHDNVRSQMAIAGYEQEPPLITFSKDMSFHINGERVHVFKTPDAHTNGDVYVHFEGSNVVHTGDVYRTTSYPYIDTANGGSFLGTIRAYDVLINMSDADTKIVPGHGVTSNVAEVRAFSRHAAGDQRSYSREN